MTFMTQRILCLLFLSLAAICTCTTANAQTPTPTPAATPPASDIYIVDLTDKKGDQPRPPMKITSYAGYNNQPFFTPDGRAILYTSIRNGQADIYRYDIRTGVTTQVTNTRESEYSPTVMPDGKHISVVRVEADGTQRLWKFPLAGGAPSLILGNIKPVGYHWWLDKHTLALFVLGSAGKPHTLQIADVLTGQADVIAENPGRILRRIPNQNKLSFVHKLSDQDWLIKSLDLKTRQISTLIKTLPGSEDYAWTPEGALLMAKDTKIFRWEVSKDKDWVAIADISGSGLKSLTRIAVNGKGDRIAIVGR
jgi:tricorn protease-like protein